MFPTGATTKTKNGFTLLELLLYITVAAIVITAVSMFLSTLVQIRVKDKNTAEAEFQGNQAIKTIVQALHNASAVNGLLPGQSANSLSLQMPNAPQNPTVFSLAGGIVTDQEGSGPAVALTNSTVGVSNLVFTNVSRPGTPAIIQINFTIDSGVSAGQSQFMYQRAFTTSATLRQ